MVKFASNFCYCAVDQEKTVFQWKRVVSGPSGTEMVKFAANFCYCAVDQEKAVFKWKRAVSGPSALGGPDMSNLLRISAIVLETKQRPFLNGNGLVLPHLLLGGPDMSNLLRISAIVL